MIKINQCISGLMTVAIALYPLPSRSQLVNPQFPPVEIDLFQIENTTARPDVIHSHTPYLIDHTIPSLWWTTEQQITSKLVRSWLIYPKQKRIDILINTQLWSILSYVEKYRVISQYGKVSRGYGYSVRIFNPQQVLLGAYYCLAENNCKIWFESANNINLRGRENTVK